MFDEWHCRRICWRKNSCRERLNCILYPCPFKLFHSERNWVLKNHLTHFHEYISDLHNLWIGRRRDKALYAPNNIRSHAALMSFFFASHEGIYIMSAIYKACIAHIKWLIGYRRAVTQLKIATMFPYCTPEWCLSGNLSTFLLCSLMHFPRYLVTAGINLTSIVVCTYMTFWGLSLTNQRQ